MDIKSDSAKKWSEVPMSDTPVALTEQEWPDNTRPYLSIECLVFNHGKFLERCFKGFLEQETTFPVEIIVHDDASTDGCQEIIRRYQDRYPSIFRVIYQESNQYSRGVKPGWEIRQLAEGKYIATCEGDDYWNDPRKLETQVKFLDANPAYVISCHDACIIDENESIVAKSKLPDKLKRDFSGNELIVIHGRALTLTRVFRNLHLRPPPESRLIINGDDFLTTILGQYGSLKFHHEIKPAFYRRHSGGIWSALSKSQRSAERANTFFWLHVYYSRIGRGDISRVFFRKFLIVVFRKTKLTEIFRAIVGAKIKLFSRWR